jgi:hypothetical protein
MSAPRLLGTSGLGASRSATGSFTRRSRQERSNARRSDTMVNGRFASEKLLPWPYRASTSRCEGLTHQFVWVVTVVSFLFWLMLGASNGYFYERLYRPMA